MMNSGVTALLGRLLYSRRGKTSDVLPLYSTKPIYNKIKISKNACYACDIFLQYETELSSVYGLYADIAAPRTRVRESAVFSTDFL
jgi:hypothetical protein